MASTAIKLNLSGEEITGMGAEETPMAEEEVAMAVVRSQMPQQGGGSACPLVRLGQAVYPPRHPEHLPCLVLPTPKRLDMLEAVKDKHFVAPGIAWLINTARYAEQWGIKPGSRVCRCSTSASLRCVLIR